MIRKASIRSPLDEDTFVSKRWLFLQYQEAALAASLNLFTTQICG
ncbi:hypothetical protein [Paenibacillus foliorum]|nr:hypothetical protein [Paenibacillus foliorum]